MMEFEEIEEPEDWELLELDELLEGDVEESLDRVFGVDTLAGLIEEDYEGPSQEFREARSIRAWRVA